MKETDDDGRIKRILHRKAAHMFIVLFILFGTVWSVRCEDQASNPGAVASISDLVVVRPVAAVGSFLSTAVFVVTLPFTYPDNNGFDTLRPLVERPWHFVTDRPLGIWKTGELTGRLMNDDMDSRYSGILGRTFADTSPEDIR